MSIPVLASNRVVLSNTEEFRVPIDQNKDAMHELGFERVLASAAEFYNLSKDIRDYFLVGVPIIWSDLPNRNGIAFPLNELTAWNKVKGCMAYQGWKGQAVRVEHDWEGEVIGLIPDVALRRLTGFHNDRLWKVVTLLAIDRTKNPRIASSIEERRRNTYSMGCRVRVHTCSYCGAKMGECSHLNPKAQVNFYELNGKLVYCNVHEVDAEEVSSVADPAYGIAVSDVRLKYLHEYSGT